jgi:hypothetical protein
MWLCVLGFSSPFELRRTFEDGSPVLWMMEQGDRWSLDVRGHHGAFIPALNILISLLI